MKRDQVINQLKDLYYNLKNFQEIESKEEDVKALEYAINELEKTAPEVPVQEQYVVNISNHSINSATYEEMKTCLKQLDNILLSGHRI